MKTIILKIAILFSITLFMSGCNNGEQGFFKSDQPEVNRVEIINCNTNGVAVPDGYTEMLSGDLLVNDTNGTVVSTYHDNDGIKRVCLISGNAHLER